MDLKKLFETQRHLDNHIEQENPQKEKENRLHKKILALLVELGELGNELPETFKFWSNKTNNNDRALKEYVDGLHFLLSIGIELDCDDYEYIEVNITPGDIGNFIHLFGLMSKLWEAKEDPAIYYRTFNYFLGFGLKMLGFSWEQIEQAYLEKNAINHQRQEEGY